MKKLIGMLGLLSALGIAGCTKPNDGENSKGTSAANSGGAAPRFVLAWSEYPSWSVFGVADEQGLIDGKAGAMGTIEKKWNVDIELNLTDYDTCISQFGSNVADAVCITNMDILSPSLERASVAILPTSTSVGADACIAVGVADIEALKGVATHGLAKSVSQYCFERVLEKNGQKPDDYKFENMDPGAAATAMQSGQAEIQSIMVWNPFVMQTLAKREDAKVIFDSSSIPEEIIDMVVLGKDSLDKAGGKRFAYAVLETFYAVNQLIDDEKTKGDTLVALGAKFSQLGLEDMKKVVTQTQFYNTPEKGLALMQSDKFLKETMPAVAEFLVTHDMAEKKPVFGLKQSDVQLNFDSTFLQGILDGVEPASVK